MSKLAEYRDFLERKSALAADKGLPCSPDECNPLLKPHQRDIVAWAVRGGRRAIFAAFGLGKTFMQIEIVRLVMEKASLEHGLIVVPLGVRQEFIRDAAKLGVTVRFVKSTAEMSGPGVYLTNYETVRDGKLDMSLFGVVSLDEASCLRGFGGTKTFREMMRLFEYSDTYRFVATATPSPNEFIELLAYAAFLDVMDVGQAKTRWFKRNSEKADHLTIRSHKEAEFWNWVTSWAIMIQRPSDLGYSDEGYDLPPLDVRWHMVDSDHSNVTATKSGQNRMFADTNIGVVDASREKRSSLPARMAKLAEIRGEDPYAHRVIWHDLEAEREAIEREVLGVRSVYGSQNLDEREQTIIDFSDGKFQELAAKPVIAGSGCNFQRHCSWAVFLGIGFKFNDFIQAVHRLQRFQQPERVRIDIIFSEAEAQVKAELERKWRQHEELVEKMTSVIREHGLAAAAKLVSSTRSLGVTREVAEGPSYRLANDDCVEDAMTLPSDSVGLVVTSVPLSNQYEYTPSFNDFGHTDDDSHFFAQMDFLTPELLRIMMPGRILAVHCKDRITPSGLNGMGFQTVSPFHAHCIRHYTRHGFGFLGMKTIVTDVVRENSQTYRLGWTEQCKDGTKMGCGMPEYLLLFRKPPTDRSDGYADLPVVKDKEKYSRGRWQFDAHALMRSSGDRILAPDDLKGVPHNVIFKLFRKHSLSTVYDFEHDVELAESLDNAGMLSPSFMLLQPQSHHPDVWTDVARTRTLNGDQAAKGREMHICPLQFDIVDRMIAQYSMPGEVVYDPFSGLGTVPLQAVKAGRVGWGSELNAGYWADSVKYLREATSKPAAPTLFELEAEVAEFEEAA